MNVEKQPTHPRVQVEQGDPSSAPNVLIAARLVTVKTFTVQCQLSNSTSLEPSERKIAA